MSFMHRLFGKSEPPDAPAPQAPVAQAPVAPGPQPMAGDTATVRRIVAQLDALPPDRARWVAAAGYVLARVANADLAISDEETAFMEQALVVGSGISEAEAVIVVESAKQQAWFFGGTEDFLVTREFGKISTPEDRLRLLRGCFLAAAADESISSAESATLNEIANELQVPAPDLAALRTEFADHLSVVQAMRAQQSQG
jgi:uncharacterized tellurite resistance protein B-like protein